MIKKVQKRFMRIVLLALITIVFTQVCAVNIMNVYQRDSEVKNILHIIAENGGILPSSHDTENYIDYFNPFKKIEITKDTPYTTRYFVVFLKGHYVTKINIKNLPAVNENMAVEFASKIVVNPTGFGFIDDYRYYYIQNEEKNSSMIICLDYTKELVETFKLASLSSISGFLCVLLLLIPIKFFSKKAMLPVEKAINKQRQFITDAGHELKTPIAIISADADVLEMCEGKSEWIDSIKNQTVRLDRLVKNLVTLSKLGEDENKPTFCLFDFSSAVSEIASSFETLAKANGVEVIYDIAPSVNVFGNEGELKQLVSILCDNAVKYSTANGIIKISLYRSGKTCYLDMYNDCENLNNDKLEKLFDRFYRADSSRSRETGGYGIGLSIAQIIVQRHKGKIKAVSTKPNSITFKITLSSKPFRVTEKSSVFSSGHI